MTETPTRFARWVRRRAANHPTFFSSTYRFWQALVPALVLATPQLMWSAAHSHPWRIYAGMLAVTVVGSSAVAIGVSVIHVDKIDQLVKPTAIGLGGAALPIGVAFAVSTVEEQPSLWSVVVAILAATWAAYWLAAWPSHDDVANACYARAKASRPDNVRHDTHTGQKGGERS